MAKLVSDPLQRMLKLLEGKNRSRGTMEIRGVNTIATLFYNMVITKDLSYKKRIHYYDVRVCNKYLRTCSELAHFNCYSVI